MSKQYSNVWVFFGGGGGGGACTEANFLEMTSEKNFIRHFAQFNFSYLSFASILKYYPILHVVKIRLASKISVKLGEKLTSDF